MELFKMKKIKHLLLYAINLQYYQYKRCCSTKDINSLGCISNEITVLSYYFK